MVFTGRRKAHLLLRYNFIITLFRGLVILILSAITALKLQTLITAHKHKQANRGYFLPLSQSTYIEMLMKYVTL